MATTEDIAAGAMRDLVRHAALYAADTVHATTADHDQISVLAVGNVKQCFGGVVGQGARMDVHPSLRIAAVASETTDST